MSNLNGSPDKEIHSLYMTVGFYAIIIIIKLIAYFSSHVMALLAESFHTLSDLFISGFLLIAILCSRKSADKEHMIGHGRAQNVAALSGVEGPWIEYIGPDSIHVDLQVK